MEKINRVTVMFISDESEFSEVLPRHRKCRLGFHSFSPFPGIIPYEVSPERGIKSVRW